MPWCPLGKPTSPHPYGRVGIQQVFLVSTWHPFRVSTRSTLTTAGRKISLVKHSHALAALIDEVRSANGWSDPDVVARAQSKGHKLSKSNISRIRNNPVVTLNIETVSALADGLGISKAMIAQAALASMGIVTYSSSDLTAEDAIRRDPTLGERDKRAVLAVLAGLRGEPASDRQDTNNEAGHTNLHPTSAPDAQSPGSRGPRAGQKTRRGLSAVPSNPDAPVDGNIPLPDNWQELAAYTGPTGHKERESEWAKRGEESQDSDDES